MIMNSGTHLDILLPAKAAPAFSNDLMLEETEHRYITDVLHRSKWQVSGQGGAAEILGLKRTTLLSKMKKVGICRPPHE